MRLVSLQNKLIPSDNKFNILAINLTMHFKFQLLTLLL